MRRPPVHDHRGFRSPENRIDTGFNLRDHTAGHGAVTNQRLCLADRQVGDEIAVTVENARDIGQHQHAGRAKRRGDCAGSRIGIDIVGLAAAVASNRRHDRDQLCRIQRVEDTCIDMVRLADEAEIDGFLDGTTLGLGRAVGISGKDGGLIRARKLMARSKTAGSAIEDAIDLGFVGEPEHVDTAVLEALNSANLIPVVAPVGSDAEGETYNINADTAAGAIAAALGATRMLMLTDVAGVLDGNGTLIPELTVSEAESLIRDGTVSGGMIPKVETCINAVLGGAEAAVIMDGRAPHALLVELFTEHGMGTIIKAD